MFESNGNLLPIMMISLSLGLFTFFIVTTTSFLKIAVVLFIVRNAVGIQQTPPNLVLYGIALALTAFVAAPIAEATYAAVFLDGAEFEQFSEWIAALQRGIEPTREFLARFTLMESREFFMLAAQDLWQDTTDQQFGAADMSILIPSFLVSELQRAFEIGLLLYLPFIIIDLVVTTILMAMGMSQVAPNIISTPMKLFLFVTVDGWNKLVEGLILTYAA
ncbi:type III secretion system export apparatus subunit SctR [uncultured Tateyamaria sp.]|uniref:type III secretion system export apparatus subunit SctR n=1 Tax=uncultured Tateyamaria sp. TaxID=455651 RepID=UPI00260F470C|nr:type III secretion system export apparatus subunit SctR [uncultured Tateyamaria sp.]